MTQFQEYLAMGFKLMPSGRINHHLWYGRKYGHASAKDSTWVWESSERKIGKGHHTCCMSRKAYCHKVGCKLRIALDEAPDDLSDLKDL